MLLRGIKLLVLCSEREKKERSKVIQNAYQSMDKATKGCFVIQPPGSLKTLTEFFVYAINSDKKGSYLFTAMQANSVKDQMQVLDLENKMISELTKKIKGECEIHQSSIRLDPFDFQDWVLSNGGILKSFEVGETSVSFGFLEKGRHKLDVHSTDDNKMLSVGINSFDSQNSVKNNVYLYFPKNDKYILYTRKGNKILDQQFAKLLSLNVKELHIKKDDMDKLKEYNVEQDIKNKVKDYKNKKSA